jgi:hypothetical protein
MHGRLHRRRPSLSARESVRHNLETRFNSREKLAKKAAVISGTGAAEFAARDKDIDLKPKDCRL